MIRNLEAVVDETGRIRLLTQIHLQKSRRALVTILDEGPKSLFVPDVEMPTNEIVPDEAVLGVWANRAKSAPEIARDLRERNR
ncbi:MAG: hypothetical protein M3T96_09310 [Acidobacteriota bacterium]|nr:hypothetical protein [Acidobacteriota bacterium]